MVQTPCVTYHRHLIVIHCHCYSTVVVHNSICWCKFGYRYVSMVIKCDVLPYRIILITCIVTVTCLHLGNKYHPHYHLKMGSLGWLAKFLIEC